MLSPKFWTLVKRQGIIFDVPLGFMQTYIKMHRTSRSSHYAGGYYGPIKPVGQDDFGNKYYEDFDTFCKKKSYIRYVSQTLC